MDLVSIIDWAKVTLNIFISKIFSFSGQGFFSILSPSILNTILFFIIIISWLFIFYYFLLPLLFNNMIKSANSEERAYILSLIPKRTKILYAFVLSSIIYFTLFVGIINFSLTTFSKNKYYAITNTTLVIDQDEEEKQQILLEQLGIDETDTIGVYKDKLTSPDKVYNIYIKQNYPSINVSPKGYVKVCYGVLGDNCTDKYEYKINKNNVSNDIIKNGVLNLEIDDNPIYLNNYDGEINSNEFKQIVYLFNKKGLLTIFGKGTKTTYTIVFSDKNDKNYTVIMSPSVIHRHYINTISYNNLSTISLKRNVKFINNIGVKESIINKIIYPWMLEGKMNYPKDIVKQVRTYNVDGVSAIYTNIIPYQELSYANFFRDLKSQKIDITKLVENLFGSDIQNNIIDISNIINNRGSDKNNMLVKFLSFAYSLVPLLYPIAILIFIIILVLLYNIIMINKYKLENIPNITSKKKNKGKEGNKEKIIILAETITKLGEKGGLEDKYQTIAIILGGTLTIIFGYLLLYLIVYIGLITYHTYHLYSTLWLYIIVLGIVCVIIAYTLSRPLYRLIYRMINKLIDITLKFTKLN